MKTAINTTLKSGVVFTFDGPDGVGKTTQIKLAAEELQRQGYPLEVRRIMGGTPIGEALRTVIFNEAFSRPIETDMHIVLAIYTALAEETNKLRKAKKVVLIDRSPLSVVAYQGYGGGLDIKRAYEICDQSLALFRPDSVLIYTAPETLLTKRRGQRHADENNNYYENQQREFHRRVMGGYQAAAKHYRAQVIDASSDIETIHHTTMQRINQVLAKL